MRGFDVMVVGGGIVGLATARELACRHRLSTLVLERELHLAAHQTGHNSGVLHSGLYYRPASHKALACVEGRVSLSEYVTGHSLPWRRCGKLVVARSEAELGRLDELERRGRANGLAGLEGLDAAGVREHEPDAAGVAGLWVPETAVVDFAAVARSFAGDVERAGGTIRLGAGVDAIRVDRGGVEARTRDGLHQAELLVACAGLGADRLARLAGLDPAVRIVPFRGEYFELEPAARGLVRGLIYPVPDPELPFLGVHLSRTVDDRVLVGPNAVLAWRRDGYRRGGFALRDAAATLGFAGFWRMARRHAALARGEYLRAWSPRRFAAAVGRLVPAIESSMLRSGPIGIRAQAVDRSGVLVDDFVIAESERMLHVLNAPSPAATASMAIGRRLAERAVAKLGDESR